LIVEVLWKRRMDGTRWEDVERRWRFRSAMREGESRGWRVVVEWAGGWVERRKRETRREEVESWRGEKESRKGQLTRRSSSSHSPRILINLEES